MSKKLVLSHLVAQLQSLGLTKKGGRYEKRAHESWPLSTCYSTHKVAQNHLLAHSISRYKLRLLSASFPAVGILAFHVADDSW